MRSLKQILTFCLLSLQIVCGQTNIAVPSYSATTNSFNASTGNIKFYLNGVSQTLTVGRGANAVAFYGSDMFVAMDDGIGIKGIMWYANVSFSTGTFTSDAPVVLANGQGTFSLAVDASGNVYSANNNGTVTKFIRNASSPYYSSGNVVNTSFWANGGFAETAGVFVDTATQTLWAVSYANNQGAVVKLSDFDYADGFGNNTKIKRFADNNSPNSFIQKPEGIAKDASGNIWIANNNNNYVLRLNNAVVTSFINDLDAEDYSFVTLNASQINDFEVSPTGHQLGGLVYDNLYSSKMYVNDQVSGGISNVYSFTANNSTPTFTQTTMSQIFPGAGQCAIIPCALLPTPSNPTANNTSINSGQTAILTASNCAADQTYLWKQGITTVGTSATYTTPILTSTTSYTVHCVRAGTCQSSGTNVTVTVNSSSGVTQNASISVSSNLQTNNPRTRTFTFRLPQSTPNCNLPLLIVLHGDGGTGSSVMNSTGFNAIADANNFIAVYPDAGTVAGSTQWNKFADNAVGSGDNGSDANAPDDEQFISDLIDYFYNKYGINRSKVYVTGHSGGGFMTYFLAISDKTKNKIAAISPVAASLWGNNPYLQNQFSNSNFVITPVLHIHSTTDGTVAFPTLGSWTWPLASFSSPTCNTSSYTTTAVSGVIDKHTFCGTPKPVLLMGLKQAGLGHAWPTVANSTYNAAQEIWDFCNSYTKGTYTTQPTISPTSITINSGSSTTLTASGCGLLNLLWSNGQTASTITVSPLSTTTYTVICRSTVSNCQVGSTSAGATVIVSQSSSFIVNASPSIVCAGSYSQLTASNCAGSVSWSNGTTATMQYVYPNTTTTYTATCSAGGIASVTVAVNPNPDPTITSSVPTTTAVFCGNNEIVYLQTGQTTTLTASGCTGTITWDDYTTTSTGNTLVASAPSLVNDNGMKYINVSCTHSNGCISYGFSTIINQFATDDIFSTTVNTPVTGNVLTNDTETSLPFSYMIDSPSNGTVTWQMSMGRPTGVFTYTPNMGFEGTDIFTYVVTDDLTCSTVATVTITVGSSNPCVNNLLITNFSHPNYSANQVVKAGEYIATQSPPNIVISNANSNILTYQAGKSVVLNPGFSVENGAVFTAQIGGCDNAQVHETMYMQGRHLYDTNEQKILPVGLNYPTDYWQFSGTNEKVNEVEQSGANMARIIWFQNPLANTSHTDTDLNTILTKFAAKKIIPVLNIWDGFNGCPQNPNKLNDANGYVSWWTEPSRVAMLNTHKKYLIINLVNELGFGYSYNANNPADVAAFTNWRNQYKIAITTIRNAGLHVPIMIDAPLCGGSLALVNQAAAEIMNHDPDHNIIFSVHAYWAVEDQTNLISNTVANNIPVIFGEIASKQVGADDWNTNAGYSECYYGIDGTTVEHAAPSGYSYKNLLPILKTNEIGWLTWEWFNDACSYRNMTTNGNYNTLTTFGNDVVNHATYGMKNIAVKSNGF